MALPAKAGSQLYTGTGSIHEVFVGTEMENYLRYLDLTDTSSHTSWSIRPLSPGEIEIVSTALRDHPWRERMPSFAVREGALKLGLLSPSVTVRFNSQFPYGSDDAAVWAGRGITSAAQLGFFLRAGPLSLTLLPSAFTAQNADFPLASSPLACGCGEPFDARVDRPQRFGTARYGRVDPGQSSIRVDALGASAGFSTANEGWGPSIEYPFILGNNAPGFPHLFFGTVRPLPIFIGRFHARIIYGRLDQSNYSPVEGPKFYASRLEPGRVRFASGVILDVQPRGFDGLEIGAARFLHSIWPSSGIPASYARKPLQAFFKVNSPGIDQQVAGTDNQLASAFFRWAFRPSGLEFYGEYGREDNSYDLRDLMQEPDHSRAYSLGLAKVITRQPNSFSVLRVELMNFLLPPLATTFRGEGEIYIHSVLRQGHTNRGQLLGADVGVNAAGASTLRWDHYATSGRWAIFWHRNVRLETSDVTIRDPNIRQVSDVLHAFGYERMKFTRRFDITTSLVLMRDLSRNLTNSRFNANAVLGITIPQ